MIVPNMTLFAALFIAGAIVVIGQTLLSLMFKARIKSLYPEKWQAINSSRSSFLTIPISGWYRFTIIRRNYRNVPDRKIAILGEVIRILYFLFLIIFAVYAALLVGARYTAH